MNAICYRDVDFFNRSKEIRNVFTYVLFFICIILCIKNDKIHTIPFKSLESVRFLNVFKRISYAHQGCIRDEPAVQLCLIPKAQ